MKEFEGAIRLLHCITATTAEEFYYYYPSAKRTKKRDYWNRLLGENDTEYKQKKRQYMRKYREQKK